MSEIAYHRLRSLTGRELARALLRDGFILVRQTGSHQRYTHLDGRRVTVPLTRTGQTFAIGTLKSILEIQARWTMDDLRRLGILP